MTASEARDLIGDYVLGTLDGDARLQFEAALAGDPVLAAEVDRFTAHLQGLDDTATPADVPLDLWSRIDAQLDQRPAAAVTPPRRRPNVPPWLAMAASIVAAAGIGFLAGQSMLPAAPRPVVIAVLVSSSQQPGAIVEAFANNSVHIIPLEAVEVPQGKILEVWTKPNEEIGAVSLGRFLEPSEIVLPASTLPVPQNGQLYEITLEDAPGSPTGKPTGPILFKGLAQLPI